MTITATSPAFISQLSPQRLLHARLAGTGDFALCGALAPTVGLKLRLHDVAVRLNDAELAEGPHVGARACTTCRHLVANLLGDSVER